jgi:hypothetical protein
MIRTLECPNCGGTVELKYERTINAVCIQCLSVLDATTPALQILQKFEGAQRFQPKIPLGKRGKLPSGEFEAIGFQVRSIEVEGVTYSWAEYLLYNPYKGYRYLTEYNGHWNDIRTLRALPEPAKAVSKEAVSYRGVKYTHFQTASAQTAFVMGEFPWQVRVGETVRVKDYIAPPSTISSEESQGEIVWSLGEYTPSDVIWKAFALPGAPPAAVGIYANQPSPYKGKPSGSWAMFLLLTLLLLTIMLLVGLAAPTQQVFSQKYSFAPTAGEPSFVTPVFAIRGRESNVSITINTDLRNDWAYVSLALINDQTGVAYDAGREIGYYFGSDSDGNWSEGSRSESVSLPGIPSGDYYLRVEPDMERDGRFHSMNYEIVVERGKPAYFWFLPAWLLMLVPPIVTSVRTFSFENRRWAESDYGPLVQSSSEDDD